MGITRTPMPFERDFVQVPNSWLRDQRLSRRARGLLAELMTHRAGWHVTIAALQAAGPEGRDAIRSAIQELAECGYLVRRQSQGARGRFNEIEYEITDPTGVGKPDIGRFADSGSTDIGSADVGSAAPKNTSQKNTIEETPAASGDREGAEEHPRTPNARRALIKIRMERSLQLNVETLLEHAFRLGHGDPWAGFLEIKLRTEAALVGARNPRAVLLKRLEAPAPPPSNYPLVIG